jgi:hypothetical protein
MAGDRKAGRLGDAPVLNVLEIAAYAAILAGGGQSFTCELKADEVRCSNKLAAHETDEGIVFSGGILVIKETDGSLSFSNGVTTRRGSAGWIAFSNGVQARRMTDGSFRFSSGIECFEVVKEKAACAKR